MYFLSDFRMLRTLRTVMTAILGLSAKHLPFRANLIKETKKSEYRKLDTPGKNDLCSSYVRNFLDVCHRFSTEHIFSPSFVTIASARSE